MLTPDRLAEAAAELAAVERSLTDAATRIAIRSDCFRRVASDTNAWWTGPRSDAYRSAATTLAEPLRPLPAALGDATDTVGAIGCAADALGRRLSVVDRSMIHQRTLLLRYRADFDHLGSTQSDEVRARAAVRALERERSDIETEWTVRSRAAAATVEQIAGSLPTVGAGPTFAVTPFVVRSLLGGRLGESIDSGEVAGWWATLTRAARRSLIEILPAAIGNFDGIPVADRLEANRRAMQRALDDAASGSATWERMQQFTDRIDRDRIDPRRRFLVFHPGGDGLVAEAFGDIETADHLAVLVPGMGSTMDGFHDLSGRAGRLHVASGADTAIIAWTGYDTPAGATLTASGFEVVSDRQATRGGEQLHAFVDGLQTQTDASVTLIGHSYGSVTVGKALHDGTRVDRIVFMGSPGVGVDHVDDFPPGAADEFFASEIKGDLVANLEHFGTNPTDPDFGAEVFDSGDGGGRDPISRHSEYYDDGIAMENLAAILTGGTPTAGRTDVIEYLTEPIEDLREAYDAGFDRFQQFDIPFVDDTLIDSAIEARQRASHVTNQLTEIVVEEVGHFGQDAVEWGVDRVGGAWDRGTEVVTGWFR